MGAIIPELDPDPDRELPNEWTTVERPLLQQLAAMGWHFHPGDIDYPGKTFRSSFREVLLREHLTAAIRRINTAENLDEITIERAVRELERSDKPGGLDRNRKLTEKLIRGVSVPRATGGDSVHTRNVTVRFIDFYPEGLANNTFLAINQFRIDHIGRVGFVIPDVILFVNGIPLVIVECKSPSLAETDDGGFWKPVQAGIDQLLRYSNRRDEVELEEGVEHFFHWNQLMVSTCFYTARVATYGAGYTHYMGWKDTTRLQTPIFWPRSGGPESGCAARNGWWPACSGRPICWTSCAISSFSRWKTACWPSSARDTSNTGPSRKRWFVWRRAGPGRRPTSNATSAAASSGTPRARERASQWSTWCASYAPCRNVVQMAGRPSGA